MKKTYSKSQEILLEYFKEPFDEEDAAMLVGSENPIKSHTEMSIIWGMFRAAKILNKTQELENYMRGIEEDFDL
jgi:hypothetical protein